MGTTRKPSRSPYHHIVLRRFDGSQANVSAKTKDKDAAALMSHHSQLLVDASGGKPVPISECLETAEAICKAVNRKHRSPTPAIPYLQGMLGEHTGSDVYYRIKRDVIATFKRVLDERSRGDVDLAEVTGDDIGHFKAHLLGLGRGKATVRVYMHALGSLFQTAVKRGVVDDNVVSQVSKPARPKNSPRRPFTDPELRAAFAVADAEWRGMMLVALYTGLRLGDISRLVHRDIDLLTGHIRAAVRKTRSFEPKPMPLVLMRYFQSRDRPQDLDTPLFPRAYRWAMTGCRSISIISAAFARLVICAGVRPAADGEPICKREGAEKYAPLSFHCFRHNFTTMMKKANVAEAIARRIAGHKSIVISDIYTHLGEKVMLDAVQAIPHIIDVPARSAE
jgi:integrase